MDCVLLSDSNTIKTLLKKILFKYALNQEEHLRVFLTDGDVCCDNGNAERKIRAYSIGRANWLFADTVAGAELNADMYLLCKWESCST